VRECTPAEAKTLAEYSSEPLSSLSAAAIGIATSL
jgi:hypothetical protein